MSTTNLDGASEFLQAMRQAADIMLGHMPPARAWHPPAAPSTPPPPVQN